MQLGLAGVPKIRNVALWVTTIVASAGILLLATAIIAYMLPLSASEALNGAPKGAHELGFWLLLLLSLPLWLTASWLSALAIVRSGRQPKKSPTTRGAIWFLALLLSALAMTALKNILGFGDLFGPL